MRRLVAMVMAAMALAGGYAGSGAAAPATVDPSTPIASDGSVAPRTEGHGGTSAAFQGTGRISPISVAGAVAATPPGAEGIIGTDTRTRVNPTTGFPARATVLLTNRGSPTCTGFLINANTVVTAGHCVHRGSGGASGFANAADFLVYPGANGSSRPYGSCRVRRLHTVTGWANNGDSEYDYGAMRLSCSIGNTTGWYGYTTAVQLSQGTTVLGFPGDKPVATMWRSTDQVRSLLARLVFYRNDTAGGNSGSPVYITAAGCNPCAVAVHTTSPYQFPWPPPYYDNNSGTRITTSVYNNLTTWKNLA